MKTIHLRLSMEGAIKNWKASEFKGLFDDEFGRPVSGSVARDILRLEVAKGKKFMLMGDPASCPDFDPFKNGCPGHEQPAELICEAAEVKA